MAQGYCENILTIVVSFVVNELLVFSFSNKLFQDPELIFNDDLGKNVFKISLFKLRHLLKL